MGLLSRAGDLLYTLRFLRLLTTDFKDTNAYKMGLIDENGNKIKNPATSDEKSSYNAFHRLVFNIKKLMAKAPGGSSKIASYAAALFLIKEKYSMTEDSLEKIIEATDHEVLDFLNESNTWFLSDDKMLSPGIYKVRNEKMLNATCEELVFPKDKIRVAEGCYPVGDVFGIDVYEATHLNTGQSLYVTVGELIK